LDFRLIQNGSGASYTLCKNTEKGVPLFRPFHRIVALILIPAFVAQAATPSNAQSFVHPSLPDIPVEQFGSEALQPTVYNFGHENRGLEGFPELIRQSHLYAAVAIVSRIISRLRPTWRWDGITVLSVGLMFWEVAHRIWPQIILPVPHGTGTVFFAGAFPRPVLELTQLIIRLLPEGMSLPEIHFPEDDSLRAVLSGVANPRELVHRLRENDAVDESVLREIEKAISKPKRIDIYSTRMTEEGDLEITAHVIPANGYKAEDLTVELWTHEQNPNFNWGSPWASMRAIPMHPVGSENGILVYQAHWKREPFGRYEYIVRAFIETLRDEPVAHQYSEGGNRQISYPPEVLYSNGSTPPRFVSSTEKIQFYKPSSQSIQGSAEPGNRYLHESEEIVAGPPAEYPAGSIVTASGRAQWFIVMGPAFRFITAINYAADNPAVLFVKGKFPDGTVFGGLLQANDPQQALTLQKEMSEQIQVLRGDVTKVVVRRHDRTGTFKSIDSINMDLLFRVFRTNSPHIRTRTDLIFDVDLEQVSENNPRPLGAFPAGQRHQLWRRRISIGTAMRMIVLVFLLHLLHIGHHEANRTVEISA